MQYFKIETGKFIKYDEATGRAEIIVKTELQSEKKSLEDRIAVADPNQPSTKDEWVSWAKANYPYVDHSAEQARLDEVSSILVAIKEL